jgi:hypothetical protein
MKTNSCKSVCIFCGSKLGNSKVWTNSAKKLGCFLGMKSVTIIFGGGRWGIMGTIATSAKINGSHYSHRPPPNIMVTLFIPRKHPSFFAELVQTFELPSLEPQKIQTLLQELVFI